MTREITHMKAFAAALESMRKPAFSIGKIAPTPGLVNQFFNDSTGTGDEGEIDTRGPWNEGGDWAFVASPAFSQANTGTEGAQPIKTESSPPLVPDGGTSCMPKSSSRRPFPRWRRQHALTA
jgi:Mn-containing catalase